MQNIRNDPTNDRPDFTTTRKNHSDLRPLSVSLEASGFCDLRSFSFPSFWQDNRTTWANGSVN